MWSQLGGVWARAPGATAMPSDAPVLALGSVRNSVSPRCCASHTARAQVVKIGKFYRAVQQFCTVMRVSTAALLNRDHARFAAGFVLPHR